MGQRVEAKNGTKEGGAHNFPLFWIEKKRLFFKVTNSVFLKQFKSRKEIWGEVNQRGGGGGGRGGARGRQSRKKWCWSFSNINEKISFTQVWHKKCFYKTSISVCCCLAIKLKPHAAPPKEEKSAKKSGPVVSEIELFNLLECRVKKL